MEDRRRELGAVELRGAAVGRREEALDARETELVARAQELADLARRLDAVGAALAAERPAIRDDAHVVLFSEDGYRLLERIGAAPEPGVELDVEDGRFRCARLTGSPFPRDDRRCAVLERVLPEPGVE